MSAWGNICRICSSPADHEIFAKIPIYLHANHNEFLKWQKPINKLIEETTGLKISPDDALPKYICALCVSYLKHAVTFREQCINNALSFQFVLKYKELQRNNDQKDVVDVEQIETKTKDHLLIEENDLTYSNQRELDALNFLENSITLQQQQDKVSKALFDQNNACEDDLSTQLHYIQKLFNQENNKTQQNCNKRKKKIKQQNNGNTSNNYNTHSNNNNNKNNIRQFIEQDNCFYNNSDNSRNHNRDHDEDCSYNHYNNDDSITPISSDEMLEENAATSLLSRIPNDRDIFAYKERNFIEDDIIDMEELQDAIAINIPENSQERKCEACLNRFMFHETYEDHKNSCIHLKLSHFVDEVNQLILLKCKEISTHEFIRRMIFSIRKICEWLMAHYGDILLPDLPQYSKKNIATTETMATSTVKMSKLKLKKIKEKNVKAKSDDAEIQQQQLKQQQEQKQLNLNACPLKEDTNENVNAFIKNNNNGIINVHNNILFEIERSESRQMALKMITSQLKRSQCDNETDAAAVAVDAGVIDNKRIDTSIKNLLFEGTMDKISSNDQNIFTTPITTITNVLRNDMNVLINQSPNPANNNSVTSSNILQLNVTARCQPCGLAFETLGAFEVHNALYHNCIKKGGLN